MRQDDVPLQWFTSWGYLFQAPVWEDCAFHMVLLTQVLAGRWRLGELGGAWVGVKVE